MILVGRGKGKKFPKMTFGTNVAKGELLKKMLVMSLTCDLFPRETLRLPEGQGLGLGDTLAAWFCGSRA